MGNFKKAILFMHRWLGFISGLVVFVISITGCIYCFQDEIQDSIYSYRKVAVQNKPFLQPSVVQQLCFQTYPDGKITSITYNGPDRPLAIRMAVNKKVMALYFDPYSGKLLYKEVFRSNFFGWIRKVHVNLFLPKEIGKAVSYVSVIIFVVIMITGLVLWWPKRKSDRRRSFTIKWGAKWKRVNYDLHNVLGFYVTAIVLITAISGLSFSLKWVNKGIYNVANLGRSFPSENKVYKSDSTAIGNYAQNEPVINQAYATVRKNSPAANYILILLGAKKSASLLVTAYPVPLEFSFSDHYAFDQYSGKLLNFLPNAQKSAGLKLNNMNYDIHTGQIAGLLGKIVVFLTSLISATLPVTGLIIYLGKKKKPKKKQVGKPLPFKKPVVARPLSFAAEK